MSSIPEGAFAAVICCTCSLTKKDCFLFFHPPASPSLIQQGSVTWAGRVQVMWYNRSLWSEEVHFFWNPVAALTNFFWQLHFHPVYLLFIEGNVLGQSWMPCGFSQRSHHPWFGYANSHVRSCSPLQDKVSWPNLNHIPLQSKQSPLLYTEMNHDLSSKSFIWLICGSRRPEEKIVAGNF